MTSIAAKRPTRRTQEERRTCSETALVQAAIEVMKVKGVAGLTLAEVAAVAGVSKGLVVHLYANKQGIQLAALAKLREDFSKRFDFQNAQASGVERIRTYLHGVFAGLAKRDANSRLFSALQSEALFQDQAFAEGVAAMNTAVRQFVENCLEQERIDGKQLATDDLDALATFVVSWTRGVVQMYCINEAGGVKTVNLDSMLALMDRTLDALIAEPFKAMKANRRPS